MASSPPADHLDLGLQLDAKTPLDLRHHAFDQMPRVGGGGAALVDDEVAMQLRDHGRAFPRTFQARGLDQPSRRVAGWVLEDASAVLGLDRLRLVALTGEPGHKLPGLLPIATLQLDCGRDHQTALQRAVAQRRGPVAKLERRRRPGLPAFARHETLGLDQNLAELLAPTSRVLVDGAADRARN